MLKDKGNLDKQAQRLLFRRCISAAWKQTRQDRFLTSPFSRVFWYYIYSQLHLVPVHVNMLNWLKKYISKIPGIRRKSD